MKELRTKGVALYFQVENYIKDKILSNEWPGGYQLLSEPDLAKKLNVSRATIRQAIHELEESGMLVRKHGVGTFVAESIYEDNLISRYLPDELGKRHRLVYQKEIRASRSWAEKLQIPLESLVYEIRRTRFLKGNDSPVIIETSYLEAERFPHLLDMELSGNVGLYDILKNEYHTQVIPSKIVIEPVLLKTDEAQLLDCSKGQPALLLTRTCSDAANIPVIVSKSLIRPDKCRIVFTDFPK